jgi:YD repeat-containing protein
VRILWFVPLLAVLAVVGIFVFLNFRLVHTAAYKDSVAVVESSQEAKSMLGDGIKVIALAMGYDLRLQGSEFAEWSVKMRGSRGTGHLYGVANKINGSWEFSRLVIVSDAGSNRVDLNAAPPPMRLPSVPAKEVYLIPIGLSPNEPLDWAPNYYKAKLGISVTVLPSAAIGPEVEGPDRQQLNADKCIDSLLKLYPDLVRDPFAILIGVTSRDIYIPSLEMDYAENLRTQDRFAIVSSARLHPPSLMERWNPEWLNSRLQKLLTKNLVMLYFDLPMSSDCTSALSGGVLVGIGIDQMGGQLVGADGEWKSFITPGSPGITIYDVPGKPVLWNTARVNQALPDTGAQVFSTDLSLGLFVQRKMDFIFDDKYPLQFTRIYRNQDDRSRAFGIGGSDSLDIFLVGQMGVDIDLIMEDGSRAHFIHSQSQPGQPDTYSEQGDWNDLFAGAKAHFDGRVWCVERTDGWKFFFPYHPNWLTQYVTVLGSFTDPEGRNYEIERDGVGDLLSITTPSGKWLHFENDAQHRIRRITSSLGRTVQYEYDSGGRLIRVTDSEGHVDSYTYDDEAQMLTAGHSNGPPILTNAYGGGGYIKSQIMADGRKLEFSYFLGSRHVLYEIQTTDPNGLLTEFLFGPDGYTQTLPSPAPH